MGKKTRRSCLKGRGDSNDDGNDDEDDNVSTCSMFKNKSSFIIWNSHKGSIFYDWIMRDDRMMRKMARKVVMMMTKTTTKCYCIG